MFILSSMPWLHKCGHSNHATKPILVLIFYPYFEFKWFFTMNSFWVDSWVACHLFFSLCLSGKSQTSLSWRRAPHADPSCEPVLEQPRLKSMQQKVSTIPIIAGPGLFFVCCAASLEQSTNTYSIVEACRWDWGQSAARACVYVYRLFNQLYRWPAVDLPRATQIQNLQGSFIPFWRAAGCPSNPSMSFNLMMVQVLAGGDGGGGKNICSDDPQVPEFLFLLLVPCPLPSSRITPFKPAAPHDATSPLNPARRSVPMEALGVRHLCAWPANRSGVGTASV